MTDVLRVSHAGSDRKCTLCQAGLVSYIGGAPNACDTCGKTYCSSCFGLLMKFDDTPRDDVTCARCDDLKDQLATTHGDGIGRRPPKRNERLYDESKPNASVDDVSSENNLHGREVDGFNAQMDWSEPYEYRKGSATTTTTIGMDGERHSTSESYGGNNGLYDDFGTAHGSSGTSNDLQRGKGTGTVHYGKNSGTADFRNSFSAPFGEDWTGEFGTADDVTDSDDDLPCYEDIPHALILAGVFSDAQLRKSILKQHNKSMSKHLRVDRKDVKTITPTEKARPKTINKNKNTRSPKGNEKAATANLDAEDVVVTDTSQSNSIYQTKGKIPASHSHSSRKPTLNQNTVDLQTIAREGETFTPSREGFPTNDYVKQQINQGKDASSPTKAVNVEPPHGSNAKSKATVAKLCTNDTPQEVDSTSKSELSADISETIPTIPRMLASSPTLTEIEKHDQFQSSNPEPEPPVVLVTSESVVGNSLTDMTNRPSGITEKGSDHDSNSAPRQKSLQNTSSTKLGQNKTETKHPVDTNGTVSLPKNLEHDTAKSGANQTEKLSVTSTTLVYGPVVPKTKLTDDAKERNNASEKHESNESNSLVVASGIQSADDFQGEHSNMYDSFDEYEEEVDESDLPFAMSLVRPTAKRGKASPGMLLLFSDEPGIEGSDGGSIPEMNRSAILFIRPHKPNSVSSRLNKRLEIQVSSGGRNKTNAVTSNASGDTILKSFSATVADQRHSAFMKTMKPTELAAMTCTSCRRPECQGEQVVQMKSLVSAARQEGFDICDVISDGNCMFAAIVDQLRQYGDHSFEAKTVREAAVNWLVENPCSADGTPFAQFMEESWDTYLEKMRNDGQWGDHVVLRAVSEFLGRTVRVLNPGNDELWTVITPQTKTGPDVTDRPLHLGHVGEFHYMSLRYADRRDEAAVVQAPTPSAKEAETSGDMDLSELSGYEIKLVKMFDETYIDEESRLPVIHFSFLLKTLCDPQTLDSKLTSSLMMSEKCNDEKLWFQYDLHNRLKDAGNDGNSYMAPFPVKDGHRVVSKREQNLRPGDFILDSDHSHPGFTRLLDTRSNSGASGGNFVPHSVCKTYTPIEMIDRPGHIFDTELIHCHDWPDIACEWPARTRPEGWPNPNIIRNVIREGCHLVGEAHPSSPKPEVEWKFSFALAELTLFRDEVTVDQKTCYMLFVGLCFSALSSDIPALYVEPLRSVFLIACERVPTELWGLRKGSCILYMVKELLCYLECRYLPNYFVTSNNMLDAIEEDRLKLAESCIRELNMRPLSILTDTTKHVDIDTNTRLIERVSDDIPVFEEDKNTKRTTLDVFVPQLNEAAKDKLTVGHYQIGYGLLTQAFEERLSVSTCDDTLPFPYFLSGALSGIDFPTAVWFCVYVSRQLGQQLSSSLLRGIRGDVELVKLEDVLPSDLVNVYGAAEVPRKWSNDRLSLSLGFARFLSQVRSLTPALRVFEYCHVLYQQWMEQRGLRQMSGVADVEPLADTMMEVYTGLYHIYFRQGNIEGFRGYLTSLQDVCERANSTGSLNLLSTIASFVGDKKLKTKACQALLQAHKTYACEVLFVMFTRWPYYVNFSSNCS